MIHLKFLKMKITLNVLVWLSFLVIIGMSVSACNDDDDETSNETNYADHLDTPWEMVFAPDGRLFFTQRPGVVSVVENKNTKTWLNLDTVVLEIGESGLLGITLDPNFDQNGFVYMGYTYAASKSPLKLINKLVRYKEDASTKTPVFDKVLLDGIEGNYIHNSGPLEFGPDGMLYWAIGERFEPEVAQDLSSLNGKILRMTRDGGIPEDNPFPNSYIYSYGHRNPQGIAFQPGTNDLWSTEHGPSEEQGCCRDEINRILPGHNYGWPVIIGSETHADMETPVYHSGDTATWAPTGAFFVTQGAWTGSMVYTGLRGKALFRVIFNPSDHTKIDTVERYLYNKFGRLRNVVQGPDGNMYIAVTNQDGRGDPLSIDDRIIVMSTEQIINTK